MGKPLFILLHVATHPSNRYQNVHLSCILFVNDQKYKKNEKTVDTQTVKFSHTIVNQNFATRNAYQMKRIQMIVARANFFIKVQTNLFEIFDYYGLL